VRDLGSLRTLRTPAAMGAADGDTVGSTTKGDQTYATVTGADVELRYGAAVPAGPRIAEANARITRFERSGNTARVAFSGHVPVEFRLQDNARCDVRHEGHSLQRSTSGIYRLARNQADGVELRCQ
jgi:hypothetical protein